jgi:hypothetical protein
MGLELDALVLGELPDSIGLLVVSLSNLSCRQFAVG